MGGDGLTRILWSREDRRLALWMVGFGGEVVGRGPVYSSPEGMGASRISSGPDGSSRVLLTDGLGRSTIWLMSPAGVLDGSAGSTLAEPAR